MAVILFHADLGCSGGFVGVDIFFVISGFLITSLILREMTNETFSLAAFWERRIRRILPALILVVLATLAAGWFLYLPEDFMEIGKSAVAQTVLLSNVYFLRHTGYFAAGSDTAPLLHTWSLSVEEQFYLLFPLLLIFLARWKYFSVSRTIACLAAGSLGLSVVGSYIKPWATFYLLPTRAWELMLGALIAAIPIRPLSKPWSSEAAAFCGLGLILYAIFFYTDKTRFPGLAAIPPCLGAALIIIAGDAKPTLIGKLLVLRPVVFLGLISYSLYLWHWPLLVFSKYISIEAQSWEWRVVLLTASVALAILSWIFIETPFRTRLLCPRRRQVFALAGGAMFASLIFGGAVALSHGMPSRLTVESIRYANYRKDIAFHNQITVKQAVAGQFAELGAQNTHQPIEILLWGDSHAMAVAPILDELCRQFSVRGVEATHAATAPLLGYSNTDPFSLMGDSPVFSQAVVDFVRLRHVKTVILAATWPSYEPPDSLDANLATTIRALLACGSKVYVLKDVPMPYFDVPKHAAMTVLRHGDLSKLAISQDKYRTRNKDLEPIFDHVSKMGATVLDSPRYFLNTNGLYDVVRGDKALYRDWHHLSVEGSKVLRPMFEPLFRVK